jgi:hypothetical protein
MSGLYSNKLFLQPIDQQYEHKDYNKFETFDWGVDTSTDSDISEQMAITDRLRNGWEKSIDIQKFKTMSKLKLILSYMNSNGISKIL